VTRCAALLEAWAVSFPRWAWAPVALPLLYLCLLAVLSTPARAEGDRRQVLVLLQLPCLEDDVVRALQERFERDFPPPHFSLRFMRARHEVELHRGWMAHGVVDRLCALGRREGAALVVTLSFAGGWAVVPLDRSAAGPPLPPAFDLVSPVQVWMSATVLNVEAGVPIWIDSTREMGADANALSKMEIPSEMSRLVLQAYDCFAGRLDVDRLYTLPRHLQLPRR